MDTATAPPTTALAEAIAALLDGPLSDVKADEDKITLTAAGLSFTLTVTQGAGGPRDPLGMIREGDRLGRVACRGDGDDRCAASRDGYNCSRSQGHPGQHIALGSARAEKCWPRPATAGGPDPLAHITIGDALTPDQWVSDRDRRDERCGTTSPNTYVCTRESGHPGQHIATYNHGEVCDVWPNEDAAPAASSGSDADPLGHLKGGEKIEYDSQKVGDGPHCDQHCPSGRWVCTREEGHVGQHIATAGRDVLEVWAQGTSMEDTGGPNVETVEAGDPDPTNGPKETMPCEYDIRGDTCTRKWGHSGQHVAGNGRRVLDTEEA